MTTLLFLKPIKHAIACVSLTKQKHPKMVLKEQCASVAKFAAAKLCVTAMAVVKNHAKMDRAKKEVTSVVSIITFVRCAA